MKKLLLTAILAVCAIGAANAQQDVNVYLGGYGFFNDHALPQQVTASGDIAIVYCYCGDPDSFAEQNAYSFNGAERYGFSLEGIYRTGLSYPQGKVAAVQIIVAPNTTGKQRRLFIDGTLAVVQAAR